MFSFFSAPKGLKIGDAILNAVFSTALFLFLPESVIQKTNVSWTFGFFLFPVSFVCGLISAWMYYRNNDSYSIDPFYIRALWAVIGGMIALPICLVFRPSFAHLAFILLTFGGGPVAAFHVYRRITKSKRDQP